MTLTCSSRLTVLNVCSERLHTDAAGPAAPPQMPPLSQRRQQRYQLFTRATPGCLLLRLLTRAT